jgi:SAM-dependent methyltransferase
MEKKALVAIANHGSGNRQYIEQLLLAYSQMPLDLSLVVLSNIPKSFGSDVEVRVGVPTPNPRSLPFAHRTLFRERIEEYDLFIYSEDDTLVRWPTLKAFLEALEILQENEIAGFLRTEQAKDGRVYFSTCHSFFRWIPSSVRQRGKYLWAKYSNEHSACFIATKQHIRKAMQSGGFPTETHEGRFDMLCSAATDIYTSCGFERLICIDRIADFTLQHLPNKYIGIMGLPGEEMQWQIDALRKIHAGDLPSYELLQPETLLPGCLGSKRYREEPDAILTQMLDGLGKNVLVWGAGDGFFEADLQKSGFRVSVFPLNAVMGECCRHRNLNVLPGGRCGMYADEKQYDSVVLREVLHLVDQPEAILEEVGRSLRLGGRLLVRVPNFSDLRMLKSRIKDSRYRGPYTRERIGAEAFTTRSLSRLVEGAGFRNLELKTETPERFRNLNRFTLGMFSSTFSPSIYLRAEKA